MTDDEEKQTGWRDAEHGLRDAAEAYVYDPAPTELYRAVTRLSGKNQLTVPVAVARSLGWLPGDEIELRVEGEGVYMEKKLPRIQALRRLRGRLAEAWPDKDSGDNYARGERAAWDRAWDEDPADTSPSGN
jgi:bifunctional DNA-binding transcriptional regulator/antitoxin component of YhaV-PrlF toxin-antitoxin module